MGLSTGKFPTWAVGKEIEGEREREERERAGGEEKERRGKDIFCNLISKTGISSLLSSSVCLEGH